jgi:hypothetical protein
MIEYIINAADYAAWEEEMRKNLPAWCGLEPESILIIKNNDEVTIIGFGDNSVVAEAYVDAIRESGVEVKEIYH